jgi:hypothetical protein
MGVIGLNLGKQPITPKWMYTIKYKGDGIA